MQTQDANRVPLRQSLADFGAGPSADRDGQARSPSRGATPQSNYHPTGVSGSPTGDAASPVGRMTGRPCLRHGPDGVQIATVCDDFGQTPDRPNFPPPPAGSAGDRPRRFRRRVAALAAPSVRRPCGWSRWARRPSGKRQTSWSTPRTGINHRTPTIGDTGQRHAARMSILQQVRPVLDAPKLDPTAARKLQGWLRRRSAPSRSTEQISSTGPLTTTGTQVAPGASRRAMPDRPAGVVGRWQRHTRRPRCHAAGRNAGTGRSRRRPCWRRAACPVRRSHRTRSGCTSRGE